MDVHTLSIRLKFTSKGRACTRSVHAIIAMIFIVIGLGIFTNSENGLRLMPALVSLLIANVSLAAISLENALDRSPVELPQDSPDST